jgi:hypothetical protein
MSSTYSTSLRAELIGSGDQAGAWGSTTNGNLSNIFDVAIAGYQTVSVTSASQALTYLNGATTTAGLNQAVYAMLRFTTTIGATFNVYAPPVPKQYIVYNNSGYSMTIYNSTVIGNTTAAGVGITIVNGDKIMVWSDGTNFYDLQAQNLTGTLAIAKGGTGQTTQQAAINALAGTQTNNRVLRSDGTNTTLSQVALTTDVTGTLPVANGGTGVTTITALGNLFYPVGSIYTSTVATNPGTSLGFGTWTQFGAGRMMMGAGGSFGPGTTGGSNDATLPSHTHTASFSGDALAPHAHNLNEGVRVQTLGGSPTIGIVRGTGNTPFGTEVAAISAGTPTGSVSVSTVGSSATNANLPPYIVVYMWQRTA